MADTMTPEMISFRRDMTLRWPCRRGDFLLWFGYRDILSGPEAIQCYDLWEMRDGYHLTITNRLEDLPPWFKLHPTEVCDSFVYKMMAKVEKGDYPSEPIDGPNLWRLKSGDRVAWVGAERPDRHSVNGILAILDCRESALAVGEAYCEFRVLPVELRSRCLRQWFKEIVLSDVTRGDTRGHENGYPGGAGP